MNRYYYSQGRGVATTKELLRLLLLLGGVGWGALCILARSGSPAGVSEEVERHAVGTAGRTLLMLLGAERPAWEAEVAAIATRRYDANRLDCSNKNAKAARILRRHGLTSLLCVCRVLDRQTRGPGGFAMPMEHAVVRLHGGPSTIHWVDATGPKLLLYDRLPPHLGAPKVVPEQEWLDEKRAAPEWRWPE